MMNHWLFKCSDITQLISKSMDEKLPLHVRIGIKCHLLVCYLCTRYKKQMDLIHGALRKIGDDEEVLPPKKLPDNARDTIKKLLS